MTTFLGQGNPVSELSRKYSQIFLQKLYDWKLGDDIICTADDITGLDCLFLRDVVDAVMTFNFDRSDNHQFVEDVIDVPF